MSNNANIIPNICKQNVGEGLVELSEIPRLRRGGPLPNINGRPHWPACRPGGDKDLLHTSS